MEEVIKNCAAVAFVAGADTTVSVILSFILAMVLNPEIQIKAQKEIDEAIDSSRLPDFSDRESLPYINAILAGNGNLLHLIVQQSSPMSGPFCMMNLSMGRTRQASAPERSMKQDRQELPLNPELIAFGFGRRICPGRHLAMNSIWLAMTYLLTSFTIVKEVDDEWKEIDPVVEYLDGFIRFCGRFKNPRPIRLLKLSCSQPLPFSSKFIP
ncbi:hypothetical protein L218DRAFT_899478, partial [Marasmius fiardii PR-910]